jgi:hypothetical protein
MFKSLMAQIFTFSEIPEELWSQATELAERLLRAPKGKWPTDELHKIWSRFTTLVSLLRHSAKAARTEPPPD